MAELSLDAQVFLSEVRFASVVTLNQDGSPQQTTMWYDLDGETILMNTAAGRVKHRNLQRDPRASFSVVDGYRWITIRGHVELDGDEAVAQADIRRLAIRYHGREKGERQARESFAKEQRVTIRLKMEHIIERL